MAGGCNGAEQLLLLYNAHKAQNELSSFAFKVSLKILLITIYRFMLLAKCLFVKDLSSLVTFEAIHETKCPLQNVILCKVVCLNVVAPSTINAQIAFLSNFISPRINCVHS